MVTVRKVLIRVGRTALMLAVALALYVAMFEKRLIFYPERELVSKPGRPHEDVFFPASDGTRLHGWFVPYEESSRVFIISHGNAGNIGYRADYVEYVHREFEANVLAYDYRGYGRSEGSPSESGTYSDLEGAIQTIESRGFEPHQIYLLGQSLGTAVTLGVADRMRVAGIILEAPFTNIREMARHHAYSIPVGYLFRSRYDSLEQATKLKVPTAIIHGRNDPVVPFALGERLYAAISSPKRFFTVESDIHEGALTALSTEDLGKLRGFLF